MCVHVCVYMVGNWGFWITGNRIVIKHTFLFVYRFTVDDMGGVVYVPLQAQALS